MKDLNEFKYEFGLGNVGAFQLGAKPYASASLAIGISSSAPVHVEFPAVTQFVTVRNAVPTTEADAPIRFGWSALGVSGSGTNYIELENGASYTGAWMCTDIYIIGTALTSSADIVAGMAHVRREKLSEAPLLNWTGTVGVG